MGIDRFYELVNLSIKRVWHKFVGRSVKNFNVENRAYNQMEKKQAAPWHETTKNIIKSYKENEHNPTFIKINSHNPQLTDRLKKIKVFDNINIEQNGNVEQVEAESKAGLPKERFGFDLPYVFFKPETIPLNKISILDLLDLLITRDRDKTGVEELAKIYNMKKEDVEDIVKYVEVFKAFDKSKKEIPMFQKLEDKEAYPELSKSRSKVSKQEISDK